MQDQNSTHKRPFNHSKYGDNSTNTKTNLEKSKQKMQLKSRKLKRVVFVVAFLFVFVVVFMFVFVVVFMFVFVVVLVVVFVFVVIVLICPSLEKD